MESFAVLEPRADGFRNYVRAGEKAPLEQLLRGAGVPAGRDRLRS